jgi:hypothetical protein
MQIIKLFTNNMQQPASAASPLFKAADFEHKIRQTFFLKNRLPHYKLLAGELI